MANKEIYTKITTHNNHLVVEHLLTASNDVVTSPYDNTGNLGYVIGDAGHIGISQEAYDLAKSLKPGNDDLGVFDLFETTDGKTVLGTMGGQYFIADASEVETSQQYKVPAIEAFQVIPNDVPEGARNAIDSKE